MKASWAEIKAEIFTTFINCPHSEESRSINTVRECLFWVYFVKDQALEEKTTFSHLETNLKSIASVLVLLDYWECVFSGQYHSISSHCQPNIQHCWRRDASCDSCRSPGARGLRRVCQHESDLHLRGHRHPRHPQQGPAAQRGERANTTITHHSENLASHRFCLKWGQNLCLWLIFSDFVHIFSISEDVMELNYIFSMYPYCSRPLWLVPKEHWSWSTSGPHWRWFVLMDP